MPSFSSPNGTVRLSPIVFLAAVCDVTGLSIFQFIQADPQSLTMRVQYLEEGDRMSIDQELTQIIEKVLADNGLENVSFSIEEAEPRRAVKGKKMKAYIKDFEA